MNFFFFQNLRNLREENVNPYSSQARVLVVTGEGKHFTAGLDMASAAQISEQNDGTGEDGEQMDVARKAIHTYDLLLKLQRHISALEQCRVPVIIAIQGYCIGAGIDITSSADIRLCSKDAKFTIKEVDIGICAIIGTIQRFQKVVGNDSWTRELAYTARFFDAEEALQKGYISLKI